MKRGSLPLIGLPDEPDEGGCSGHANRWVMKRAQMRAIFS